MVQELSNIPTWLKKGISAIGLLVFLAGLHWFWQLRDIWPRTTADPIQLPLIEAMGVIIVGLFVVNKSR
ncbi:MAG: hypothetical protein ABSE62_00025 [Chthoniobacteraceae bacterium]|jgi:hypothetical protein